MLVVQVPSGGGGGGGGGGTAFDQVQTITNADAAVAPSATKNILVRLTGLTADHTAALPIPANLTIGQRIAFVDGDGSLGTGFVWTLAGSGSTVNGLANFILAATSIRSSPGGAIGPRGSIVLEYVAANTFLVVG